MTTVQCLFFFRSVNDFWSHKVYLYYWQLISNLISTFNYNYFIYWHAFSKFVLSKYKYCFAQNILFPQPLRFFLKYCLYCFIQSRFYAYFLWCWYFLNIWSLHSGTAFQKNTYIHYSVTDISFPGMIHCIRRGKNACGCYLHATDCLCHLKSPKKGITRILHMPTDSTHGMILVSLIVADCP